MVTLVIHIKEDGKIHQLKNYNYTPINNVNCVVEQINEEKTYSEQKVANFMLNAIDCDKNEVNIYNSLDEYCM